jgi:hypothetical protein
LKRAEVKIEEGCVKQENITLLNATELLNAGHET